MAALDKNILITPNNGELVALPNIVFTGGNNVATTLNVADDGSLVFVQGAGSADTVIKSAVTKAAGSASVNVFSVVDSTDASLFEVRQNGDTVIAGILTVNGTGTSTFAGDVSIGGNLTVDGTISGGTTVDLAEDLTITGNLVVNGNTTLGDAGTDTLTVNATAQVVSPVLKTAEGGNLVNVFSVVDSAATPLFEVRQNGDTIIGGVLTVNGEGESTFAGSVNIGGNLTVDGTITGGTTVDLAEDLTVQGNLIVNGNTTLGNETTDTLTVTAGVASSVVPSATTTYNLGSTSAKWDTLYVRNIVAESSTVTGSTGVGGDLIPDVDHTYDIGAPTYRFDQGYISTVNANDIKVVTDGKMSDVNAATTEVFSIYDKDTTPNALFQVMQNGDTIIGGVLTVNGTGTSTFAGDVSIGGSLTVSESATVTADLQADNLTVTGNLVVDGNTTLGNEAGTDVVNIKGVTTITSSVTKAAGSSSINVFQVVDSAASPVPLFEVRQNGDTVIGGVLTVNGTGTSTFAGDVSIGGNLTVDGTISGGTTVDLAEDLTITGNLVVNGNTTLGNEATDTLTVTAGVASDVLPGTTQTYDLGSAEKEWAGIYSQTITTSGNITIGGDLTVNGTVTYINTETINLTDNILTLNASLDSETAPTQNAGIEVNRGSATNVDLLWDEGRDIWTVGTQKFEAAEFVGTFNGDFSTDTMTDMDARYVNVTGDSMTGNLTISGVLSATSKSFVIDHPTKPGYKLRYGSLEGPENGVYVRATVKGANEFALPDYWVGLIDPATITVNLTANGRFQPLYTVSKDVSKIVVAADGVAVADLDFDIVVFAERNDVAKIVVEYQEVSA